MTLAMIFILINNHKGLSALLLLIILVLFWILGPRVRKLLNGIKDPS
ncbi:hypothetical protein [Kluyvera ascorbata]|uniref:Uncharacterized protein n=1 Tax=Kluyvera ascorbata TaxID=51288 RepID=A0AB35X558_9ENTR|nr:hypothetical protein [Kluyvera ascorbata]HEB4876491.1 hypothetical protein [Kluyvera ascorbata F0526]MDT8700258.1 hypothetical protein [Kluyvera ascorbata]MDU3913354.1 hypothetical protein [Kluyvera ascorbata]MDZ4030163.1 hypothetical protein [Kluyvera ascorbata]MEB6386722.1 hypothetical protein [Kluyvera ascorbata]